MPALSLPVQTITTAGVAPQAEVIGDNVNGHQLTSNNGTTTFIVVTNTSVATKTITVVTPYTVAGLAIADQVYNLPATNGYRLWMGPFDLSIYGPNPTVIPSATTVTLSAYQI